MQAQRGRKIAPYSLVASSVLEEYVVKKSLAKLGFTFDPRELSVFKAHAFMIITDENAKIDEQKQKESRVR